MASKEHSNMEKIRVPKVEDVTLYRQGKRVEGTLHLTAHHIIFSYVIPPPADQPEAATQKPKSRELWITYPMINFCTYRPAPPASRQPPSIRLRGRDFTFVAFHFASEGKARDVYDSIRSLTCRLGRLEKLYAFSYIPQPPESKVNGWEIYDAEREWRRLGIGGKNADHGWRISRVNADYEYSPTYPALLVVPSVISDNVLNYAGKYRSRARIPALTYRHPVNNCSITRSSQPFAGFARNRSIQDEKLVAAIFATSSHTKVSSSPTPKSTTGSPNESMENISSQESEESGKSERNAEKIEDDELAQVQTGPKIYGAQQRNLIVDARPTVNAIAMQAVGRGSENMDYYKDAAKAYLGIDNIHVMRRSLDKVIAALKDTDVTPLGPNRELLAKSGWIQHISNLLDGSALIARQVGIQHSHALIHCSDGWDRTSQLSALSQLCLDPFYRTIEGFCVLVEKDWLSFGHMFRYRAGLLGHEKWFEVENERVGGDRTATNGAGTPRGANALENAFLSAKGLFNRKNESRESLTDSDGEAQNPDSQGSTTKHSSSSAPRTSLDEKRQTKVNEVSPIFHQFLDATYQLVYQHPTRFEFNERFLRRLLYHQYSCQYGTFLYDNEKERVEMKAKERTRSVWDYFLSRREQFTNPRYDPVIDDNVRGQERLLFPKISEVRWWAEVFGRQDDEMNGPLGPAGAPILGDVSPFRNGTQTPVLTGIETAEQATGVAANTSRPSSRQAANRPVNLFEQDAAALGVSLANLGIGAGGPAGSRERSTSGAKLAMEVEMQ